MFIVGFDLGKRKSQLCVEDANGVVIAQLRINTKRSEILDALRKFPHARVLIESSTSSEWIARLLEEAGYDVVVADPRFSPMYAHSNKKIKTDKRDAKALADALRMGAFRRAHRRSERGRALQTTLIARNTLLTSRTRYINVVRASAEREGIRLGKCSNAGRFLTLFAEHALPAWLADALAPLVEEIAALNQQIDVFDRSIEKIAREDPVVRNLMTAPGVGPLTAISFVAVVEDPKRFSSATELVAYLGLAPGQRNSSESKRRPGAITKSGNPLVRKFLYEAALSLMNVKSIRTPLQEWALAQKSQHHDVKKKAIVATARRLARILWAMWRDNKPFTASLTAPDKDAGSDKIAA